MGSMETYSVNDVASNKDIDNLYSIYYDFKSPDATKVISHDYPIKHVCKEYLLVTELNLIGSVGGALGMFVGFSFTGCTELFMSQVTRFFPILLMRKRARK